MPRISGARNSQKMEQLYAGWEKKLTNVPQAVTTWLGSWWEIIENLPLRNYQQAEEYFDRKLFRDAAWRLKMAIWLAPDFPKAYMLLAQSYMAMGETARASGAIKSALQLRPNSPEILFIASGIDGSLVLPDKRPRTMPLALSQLKFQKEAELFDEMQKQRLYRGHVYIDQMIRRFADIRRTNHSMLDLGCGTGACGLQLYNIASLITGVDFTRAMLDQAMIRRSNSDQPIYSRTFHEDLLDFVNKIEQPEYDFIVAAHVLNYVGDLEILFDALPRALNVGGLAVLQVEPYAGGGFGIIPGIGRFGHSESYIKEQAARVGLEIAAEEDVMVYQTVKMRQYAIRHLQSGNDEN
jgi:predicted TPR repeat methyltransferase